MKNYAKYFFKKFMWYLLTLVIAVTLNFVLPRLTRGNPLDAIVSQMTQGMTDSSKIKIIYEDFMARFGLNLPIWQQFFIYIKNILNGDFGISFSQYPRPVLDILQSCIPWSVGLSFPAIISGWIIGNVLGAFTAYKRGIYDKLIFPTSMFVSSFPNFVFSILMLFFLAVTLKWFPINGAYDFNLIPGNNLNFYMSVFRHYQLPFLCMVAVMVGGQAIGMRSMSIYELNSDYVLYSKLMGVSDKKIVQYVFKNGMLPQITGLALSIGTIVGGALITEIIFNYPGIGTYLFSAIRNQDYPLISGCTLVITFAVLCANFVVEILYGLIDPRIKASQMEE